MRSETPHSHTRAVALAGLFALGGCGDGLITGTGSYPPPQPDFASPIADGDGGPAGTLNDCLDQDPSCMSVRLGPGQGREFPIHSDAARDPAEHDDGVGRDDKGYLGLDSSHAAFDYLWIANSADWNRGTVSKLNSKTVREIARYFSVTCSSLPGGSKAACDGSRGCCAFDDNPRFVARSGQRPEPPHQSVNLMANSPSRTAIDFNGDMIVANRAFSGQSSVTKVANDQADCIDRNHNGRVDSSSDVSGDGLIQTDCNDNGVPDDLDDVAAAPCTKGRAQEFFGLDDECVLWTTNTNTPQMYGRPLALGQGSVDYGPSDAWAGCYNDGRFFRIDGRTGQTLATALGPRNAYGATVDSSGILWVAVLNSGRLGYFDTVNPKMTGIVRLPSGFGINAYGIAMDRDQNVWQGGWTTGHAYRYTPDRTNGFTALGAGTWTVFEDPGDDAGATGNGRGIAADSRTIKDYFTWLARDGGWVVRIDATRFPPKDVDTRVDASAFPAFRVAGSDTIGVGVDVEQNVWGISQGGSVATRALVDALGGITTPDITSSPVGGARCPAGDRCPLRDSSSSDPLPYTYSDFTGFGLRNFTRPRGTYSYVVPGCMGAVRDTYWYAVTWDADVPLLTTLTLHARTGKTAVPDQTWGPWTPEFSVSPADLRAGVALSPLDHDDYYLQVEFIFKTQDKTSTPKLKSFGVGFKCGIIG